MNGLFLPSSGKSISAVMEFKGGILNKEEQSKMSVHFKKIFTKHQDKKTINNERLIASN